VKKSESLNAVVGVVEGRRGCTPQSRAWCSDVVIGALRSRKARTPKNSRTPELPVKKSESLNAVIGAARVRIKRVVHASDVGGLQRGG
jgi:hypothetical protein